MKNSRVGKWYVGACLIAAALTAASVFAPDVQYRSSSKVTMRGAVGEAITLLAQLGGAPETYEETVSVRGNVMRTDTENLSTLIDLDEERFVHLYHDRQRYTILTFDQIRERLRRQGGPGRSSPETTDVPDGGKGSAEVHMNLTVDRTGKRDRINGFPVERVILTITAEASAEDPENAGDGLQKIGSLVVANELWMSDRVDGFDEVTAFRERLARKLGEEFIQGRMDMIETFKKAVESEPRIQQALERLETETAKLSGVPVRGTTEVLLIPADAKYAPEKLFVEEPPAEKKRGGGGLRALARGLAEKAKEAGKERSAEAGPGEQKRLLTVWNEIQEIKRGALSASFFQIPAGYQQSGR